eukprot:UN12639
MIQEILMLIQSEVGFYTILSRFCKWTKYKVKSAKAQRKRLRLMLSKSTNFKSVEPEGKLMTPLTNMTVKQLDAMIRDKLPGLLKNAQVIGNYHNIVSPNLLQRFFKDIKYIS